MPESPRDEILRLRAAVLRHEELYRKKHTPEISDYEFDQLKDRLQALEAAHPDLAGPDLGIGDDRSEGFVQREHAEPMLSLDNTYERKQFTAFVERLAQHHRANDHIGTRRTPWPDRGRHASNRGQRQLFIARECRPVPDGCTAAGGAGGV